jgi:hypothetical protein
MKSSVCLNMIPGSLLRGNWRFRGTWHLYLDGQRRNGVRNQHEAVSEVRGTCHLHVQGWRISQAGNHLCLLTGVDMFLRNVGWLNGLHGFISQKIELFIATAVRTSNPTQEGTYPSHLPHNWSCSSLYSFKCILCRTQVPSSLSVVGSSALWAVKGTVHTFRAALLQPVRCK